MADSHEFLRTLALVLCVAGATTLLFNRLRQPVVFGYLLAGMVVGPHVPLPLIAHQDTVQTMSELGVILLMFGLGLEFSLRKLFAVGAAAGVAATLQSAATVALGFLAGRALGWTPLEGVYAGAIIAISSTTIVVKAFAEERVAGRFVEVAFGVLIIQDLIAILLLAVLTAVSAGGALSPSDLGWTALRLAGFLVALIVPGLLLIPRGTRSVLRLERPEITVVAAVGLAFGAAYLALRFGYSVALGAFLAGSLVAESGEAERVEQQVQPVRDVFAALFFVAVGMLIDPRVVIEEWPAVLLFTLLVIGGKAVAVTVGAFLAGYGTRTSVQTGMSLAQIGEFSFIIAGVGVATGATRPFLYPVAVAVSAITTLTTPWLIRAAGPVASWVDRRLPRPLQNFAALYAAWMERVRHPAAGGPRRARIRRLAGVLLVDVLLLAAIGLTTRRWFDVLATWLNRHAGLSTPFASALVVLAAAGTAAPFALGMVRLSRALGQALAVRALPPPVPGKVDLGLAPRRAFLVTWQLAIVALVSVPLLALTSPLLPLPVTAGLLLLLLIGLGIAFWRSATNLQGHTRAGAEVIVAALAKQLGPPVAAGPDHAEDLSQSEARSLSGMYHLIPGLGEPVPLRLQPGDYATGRSLAQLDLRDATDATVLVIVRGGHPVMLPDGKQRLEAGDLLALAGSTEAVRLARALLTDGPVVPASPAASQDLP